LKSAQLDIEGHRRLQPAGLIAQGTNELVLVGHARLDSCGLVVPQPQLLHQTVGRNLGECLVKRRFVFLYYGGIGRVEQFKLEVVHFLAFKYSWISRAGTSPICALASTGLSSAQINR
jgi:hypothetical protein